MFSRAVISRELLAEARRRANYWIRFWAGLDVAGALAIAVLLAGVDTGPILFLIIHNSLLVLIFLAGPLLTADCISREKREGTLGLLFLTPLTPRQVVSSKFLVQAVRFLNLWLMMLPFMMLPILSGGVLGSDILQAVQLQLSLILLTLSAGLIASTMAVRFIPALVLALLISTGMLLIVIGVFSAFVLSGTINTGGWGMFPPLAFSERLILLVIFGLLTLAGWGSVLPAFGLPALNSVMAWFVPALLAATVACAIGTILRAARRTALYGQAEFETKRQIWFRRKFLTPILWKDGFRRILSRKLDRNPLLWLEYRGAWSRSGRWLMVLGIILFETFWVTIGWVDDLDSLQGFLTFSAALTLAFTAASSFQKERESNAFELLLVAPFTEASFIRGRLSAVWLYYQPVLLVLACFLFASDSLATFARPDPMFSHRYYSLLMSFATIPAAGFYFALRLNGFFATLAATIGVGLLFPLLAFDGISSTVWYAQYRLHFDWARILSVVLHSGQKGGIFFTILVHLALLALFLRLAFRRLKRRDFASG